MAINTRRRVIKKKELIADRPESLLSLVVAIVQFVLIVIGIIGITAAIFGEGGLFTTLASKLIDADIASMMITGIIVAAALYFGHRWFERNFEHSASKVYGTLAMYIMMAVGAYYLVTYLMG